MKKTIITILGLALMIGIISLVSAEIHYVGDTFEIPTDFEIINCSVTNSTYGIEGLDLNWSGKNIIVSTSPYSSPNNLMINCWVIKGRNVVEKHYSSGGGGSCSYDLNYDWECSEWGACVNENQTRTCNEYNNCHGTYGKPVEIRSCIDGVIDLDPIDTNTTTDIIDPETEHIGFWRRFWNWFKGWFGR